ncbi:Uncharacterized protein HZ326_14302 [Fusarium oxysporum f. sp. albedinis]|nr:Uncharacterized protein HZ326_14302 [Fusarium oxysporum f. sp. albedinis]
MKRCPSPTITNTIEDEVIPFAQGIVDLNLKQPLQPFSPLDREKPSLYELDWCIRILCCASTLRVDHWRLAEKRKEAPRNNHIISSHARSIENGEWTYYVHISFCTANENIVIGWIELLP